ncbi:MAG: DNA-binding protein [Gammaproteobacteria bacterium]|nr:MAG: DNA-binding protein [Gammaproteobacteria bacterium]
MSHYLPAGLPAPMASPDGLDAPFWEGALANRLIIQKCNDCKSWLWGPEWICHGCLSFDIGWQETDPEGIIYSWERIWHPVHPTFKKEHLPYIVVLVELPQAGNVRLVGNLLGDPKQTVEIGSKVQAVFEQHDTEDKPYALIQWQTV